MHYRIVAFVPNILFEVLLVHDLCPQLLADVGTSVEHSPVTKDNSWFAGFLTFIHRNLSKDIL